MKRTTPCFFDEFEEPKLPKLKQRVTKLPIEIQCRACGLDKKCKTPRMKWTGDGKLRGLFIGEAAGKSEDEEGIQFIGQAGGVLRDKLEMNDLDLDYHFWKDNALACRPPKNRTPTDKEIKYCRPHIMETIAELKPKKIFLLGRVALDCFLAHRTKISRLDRWLGQKIPDQQFGCWVYPLYHPSYLLRQKKKENRALNLIFETQLFDAINHDEPFPKFEADIEITNDVNKACEWLEFVIGGLCPVAIDFETTGLKPHAPGHKIISMSMSINPKSAFSFPMFDHKKFLRLVKRLLFSEQIAKWAQNMKFEDLWSRVIQGYPVRGWKWDTSIASHVLDNRREVSGLKFQSYVRYGVLGFDDEIDPYKRSNSKNANAFNRMAEAPIEKVLTYGGMDSVLCYRLALDQQKEMTSFLRQGYDLLHNVTIEIADVEERGIMVDMDHYRRQDRRIGKQIEKIIKKINDSREVHKWRHAYNKQFNPNSDDHLKVMLFELLGYTPEKLTARENYSTDSDVLQGIGTQFTNNVLRFKKLGKLRGTYLAQYMREEVDGIIHPFFGFASSDEKRGGATTYRGSSANPNFHNQPKHDEEAQKIIRSGVKPRPGRQLFGVDYSRIEVCISACYHKDPEMIRYLNDPKSDMHRDQAQDIFLIDDPRDVTKRLRFIAKNDFVFAQFYGDWYEHCAREIWRDIRDNDIKNHLKKHGLGTYSKFEKHIRDIERIFWEDKFPVYAKWKQRAWKRYQRTGYITLLTGFKCHGLLKRNDVINWPIQGTAAHLMFWSLAQLNRKFKRMDCDSFIIGYIHDELFNDIVPGEKKEIKPAIRKTMCEDIRQRFPWIIVPIDIEAEISEVDGNWYKMKEEPI